MQLISIEVRTALDIASAFDAAKQQGADGVVVLPDPLTSSHRPAIVQQAAKARMPALYSYREYVDAGGLLAYGPNDRTLFRRVAVYVDKILKGAKPSDLPVEQPTKFELVVNLKTAKTLGTTCRLRSRSRRRGNRVSNCHRVAGGSLIDLAASRLALRAPALRAAATLTSTQSISAAATVQSARCADRWSGRPTASRCGALR